MGPCAGLYDSIPVVHLQERPLDYASERLVWDADFQQDLLGGLISLGKEVEQALGGQPQVCSSGNADRFEAAAHGSMCRG